VNPGRDGTRRVELCGVGIITSGRRLAEGEGFVHLRGFPLRASLQGTSRRYGGSHRIGEPTFASWKFARWLANRSSLTSQASEGWRRERDSNPRYRCRYSGFQDHRHRPLGHPSRLRKRTSACLLRRGRPALEISPGFCATCRRLLAFVSLALTRLPFVPREIAPPRARRHARAPSRTSSECILPSSASGVKPRAYWRCSSSATRAKVDARSLVDFSSK
jgi:hypothetical protein